MPTVPITDILETLWWITVLKIVIGAGLGVVLIGSLYKFRKGIMTVFGLLLLSNLLTLYFIMILMS
jgi:hypothetical protein